MKRKQIETALQAEQIKTALLQGKTAMIEGKKRFPWQDNNLMETVKNHKESIQGNASFNQLFEAWLKGWDLQNLSN